MLSKKNLKDNKKILELIASENVYPAAMMAMGTVLTNKYAEVILKRDIMVDVFM